MNLSNLSTLEAAKALLGCHLVTKINGKITSGKIVETEAYLQNDPASHSYRGQTKRNMPMFQDAGTIYVYFTYGMYHCFNIVTNKPGVGEAILIRAIEPKSGINLMKSRRKKSNIKDLCNGPAKLVLALGINKKHNNTKINDGPIKIKENKENLEIISSKRIGISKGKNLKYRFYIKNSQFISK